MPITFNTIKKRNSCFRAVKETPTKTIKFNKINLLGQKNTKSSSVSYIILPAG